MTTYKHIVQVHPVENGKPNLYKVIAECEFDTENDAKLWIGLYNYGQELEDTDRLEAVYRGRVNCETGELE